MSEARDFGRACLSGRTNGLAQKKDPRAVAPRLAHDQSCAEDMRLVCAVQIARLQNHIQRGLREPRREFKGEFGQR
jgi:hypothetical protein